MATIIGKVKDSLLDKHLKLHDAQFCFRPGLFAETAILKHTVKDYTFRKTPIYVSFLDPAKAFDVVLYERLWKKLQNKTGRPSEFIVLFKYWYNNN